MLRPCSTTAAWRARARFSRTLRSVNSELAVLSRNALCGRECGNMRIGVILGPCVAICSVIAPELALAQPSETTEATSLARPAHANAGIQLQFRGLTLLGSEP